MNDRDLIAGCAMTPTHNRKGGRLYPLFLQFAACMPCFLGEPDQRNPQEQSGGNKENSRTIGLTEAVD